MEPTPEPELHTLATEGLVHFHEFMTLVGGAEGLATLVAALALTLGAVLGVVLVGATR